MLSNLSKLRKGSGKSKRVGRGYGSGVGGHTAKRGQKGQKSRSGGKVPLWFEGGQLPLVNRLPHRKGFKPHYKAEFVEIGVEDLNNLEEKKITPELLVEKGYIKELKDGVKILGNGDISKKVELSGFLYTSGAKQKIESAGGTAK